MGRARSGHGIESDGFPGRCVSCGETIGVYEPAVWAIDDGRVVVASPLKVDTGELRPSVAAQLHLDCWTALLAGQS